MSSSAASPPASSSSSSSGAAAAEAPPGATAAAAAALLLWERAWSLEEVRAGSPCWSLAADAGLLQFLQEFSQQTISRTHEIKKQMDRLIHETKSVDCRLHNVFNGFLMLSNTQFIENRVYDDEVEETISKSEVSDRPEQEKTREQKEADLIPKIQEAVNYGLQVLDSAFEQLDIKAGNSDSEEETNERIELILEPKDLYIDRPLPYLIGSQLFMEQDDVGLGDLSSEEGSVDSDRGSMIDSEGKDEEDLEEFENASEEDHKPRTALMSDEDDFFGDSEKGEDDDEEGDLEENARLKKKRPTSFTDELAARIKGEEEEQSHAKNKATVTNKEESVSSDDDGDIFKPPKLTDEDFSPFCSKDGLFSGGTGLFDDEESDLFSELPKGEDVMEKESRVPINDEPSSKPTRKVPAGAVSLFPGGNDVFSPSSFLKGKEDKKLAEPVTDKAPRHEDVGLFDDDDDGGKLESNKKSFISAKPAADLFEGEEDLFKEKPDITTVTNKAAKENKDFTAGDKSQPSAENVRSSTQTFSKGHKSLFSDEEDSEDLFSYPSKSKSSSSSKVTTKTSLSLFEDEDEEGLFGSTPKAQISKPPVKKATSLLFSSDEEDHWNIGQEVKPAYESSQKKEPTKSASAASHTVKTGLFEEEGEEDLFVITKDSQRKPPKAALLFQEDAVNGDSFFSIQPSPLPSGVQEVTQEDLLGTRQKKPVEEKAGPLGEPGTLHRSDLGGGDAGEQQRKDEPLLEKDVKKRIKSVFSLFDEEEKNEAVDADKMTQREIEKPSENSIPSKSTGVFQDEELLFSHKLQKDNDPDVDLFARSKKEVPKPRVKLPSEGGLFGADDDGDDGLFSPSKAKPLVAEKKTVISSLEEDSEVPESNKNAKREESNLKATEKSTGLGASKHRESSSRIGKLQASLDINPAVLLPSGKPPSLYPKTPIHEPHGVQQVETASAAGSNKEMGVSFDDPMQADTLQNANKGRIKVTGKRRPPTRNARRLAAQGDNSNDMNIAEDPSPPLFKESSVPPATLHPSNVKLHRKENTEESQSPLPTNSSEQLHEAAGSPGSKSAAQPNVHDLFESNDIFADSIASKVTTRPKAKVEAESLMSQVPKGGEGLPVPLALDGANSEGLFQAEKPSKKPDPTPFLEDEDDLFATSKKTVKRKDLKPIPQLVQDPSVPDIFEDDIFASEALKPPVKAKSKELEVNLFDDDVDIFADLAVKPKERSAKKKMESKSIFDEEIDDIFSPSSQSKTTIKKAQSFQAASGTKSEIRTSSTFEDPLNVFEGQ
ncbi:WASH complex subunit 2A-like isoform X7 [Podarcis raffonei]|uniref:WASH complex subunit 2A-like isoform X7 n=1 Tax=Podarcis raffonei TaxID=65483 RepID=UPI0023299F23|nr:WASH complex subunit 2A-like isoform X7 [Podarcis raffonei]